MNHVRQPEKRLLTDKEAAAYCGVSPGTFKAWVKITPTKLGSAVRYDRVAIDNWLDSRNPAREPSADEWLGKLDEGSD